MRQTIRYSCYCLMLGTIGVASVTQAAGSGNDSIDISAPPMALLFTMATVGLILGRRKSRGDKQGDQ